jgi:hypothetical protein
VRSFGQPTSALDPQFLVAWRLTAPEAHCVGSRCTKTLYLDYAIPEARRIAGRQAVFDVVVGLERGGVARVALTGFELWSRLGEAAELHPIPAGDVMARAQAIADVLGILQPIVDQAFPPDRCTRPAVAPVVLLRECDGLRLRVVAPEIPESDCIEVEPTHAP